MLWPRYNIHSEQGLFHKLNLTTIPLLPLERYTQRKQVFYGKDDEHDTEIYKNETGEEERQTRR